MVEIASKESVYETIQIQGWKGRGTTTIYEQIDAYRVVETRKSKESGEAYEDEHIVPKENVKVLWDLIRNRCTSDIVYKYKFLVRLLLEHYKFHEIEGIPLEVMMEALNGGSNRNKYYFPYFYYCIKVLEAKSKLKYFGRGGIQILDNSEL